MSVSPNPQDWMVLECRSCGSRMKSRRETALTSRLLCPKCRTPVPVEVRDEEPGKDAEFRPEPLPSRPRPRPVEEPSGSKDAPSIPATAEHPEFSGSSAFSASPAMTEHAAGHSNQHHREPEESDETAETGSGTAAPAAEDEGGIVKRLRKRVKKRTERRKILRVKYEELADWNSGDLASIPEAEIGADIWAEAVPLPEEMDAAVDEQVYLVEERDAQGNRVIRRRKMRRSKLVQGAQLFFKRFMVGSRYFTTGLAVAVAAAGVYGLYVLRQQFQEPEPIPVSERGAVDPSILTMANEQKATAVVRDFLRADGVEAKLKYVRHPARVRPMMEAFYRRPGNSAAPVEAGEVLARRKDMIGEAFYVMLAMPVLHPDPEAPGGFRQKPAYFAVEEIHRRDGAEPVYLLDWETSTAYQSMPLAEFKATKPRTPKIFRLKMKPSDYYNHGFEEKDWQSVELYYPDPDQEFHLYGYIRRFSQEGRELQAQMADYQQPTLIVELVYPEDAVSSEQVIIKRMVHPSWYYATEEEGFRAERAVH